MVRIVKIRNFKFVARCWWLTPVILGTWEAEIRRIMVPGQPGQIVHETLSPKNNQIKMDWRCGSSACFANMKP
jgi:hypothetical protein